MTDGEVSFDGSSSTAHAAGLLDKLRRFIDELSAVEQAMMGALLAPGVALAFREDEVEGYTAVEWDARALPEALAEAIRLDEIKVTFGASSGAEPPD